MQPSVRANLYGVTAILIWSSLTALVRSVTENFGVTLGIALFYTAGTVALLISKGFPSLRKISKPYLICCGLLFITYEVLYALAIGIAQNHQQVIEVSLINYLWPCLVVVFSILINKQQVSLLIWPGVILSFLGIVWAISGENFNIHVFISHIKSNPTPYLLSFTGAFLWGLYCNLVKRLNSPVSGAPLFFIGIAVAFWIQFFISPTKIPSPSLAAIIELLIVGILFATSYSVWEKGIQHGNLVLLAILSYFIPILSILFSCFWLKTTLSLSFWYGVIMVTAGSLLCYFATKKPVDKVT